MDKSECLDSRLKAAREAYALLYPMFGEEPADAGAIMDTAQKTLARVLAVSSAARNGDPSPDVLAEVDAYADIALGDACYGL